MRCKNRLSRLIGLGGLCGLFMTTVGCANYVTAVGQNLLWGLPGLIQGVSGNVWNWVSGALVNALALGVQ